MDPWMIVPPHEVRDKGKLTALTEAMGREGWQGRPLLCYRVGDATAALTGSHRIAAARAADLVMVPVRYVDQVALGGRWGWGEDVCLDGIRLTDDEELAVALRKGGDTLAAELMDAEVKERNAE